MLLLKKPIRTDGQSKRTCHRMMLAGAHHRGPQRSHIKNIGHGKGLRTNGSIEDVEPREKYDECEFWKVHLMMPRGPELMQRI